MAKSKRHSKKVQVDSISYLQQLKDHYSNLKVDQEIDKKDIEFKDSVPQIESRINDLQIEIDNLTNCIDWLLKL